MKYFCIVVNRTKDSNLALTREVTGYISQRGLGYYVVEPIETDKEGQYTNHMDIPEEADCLIVLGGDGTMIQTAHDVIKRDIPIIGINLGTLGFLAAIEKQNILGAIDALINDDYIIEERMMIKAQINSSEGDISLNDIVLTRSGFSRLISVDVYVNDALVNDYSGDGIIIATPTGSTGYSLSAGGPVVCPGAELMVITPICSHSLSARSIVVKASDVIRVSVKSRRKSQDEEAILTIDGKEIRTLNPGDFIEITKSESRTKLIRFRNQSFFDILHSKFETRE